MGTYCGLNMDQLGASPPRQKAASLEREMDVALDHFIDALPTLPSKTPFGMSGKPETNDCTIVGKPVQTETFYKLERRVYRVFDNYRNLTKYSFGTKEVSLEALMNSEYMTKGNFMLNIRKQTANLYLSLYPNQCHNLKKAEFVDFSSIEGVRHKFIIFEQYTMPFRQLLHKTKYKRMPIQARHHVMYSVGNAIQYLHERGLSHENVGVDSLYIDSRANVLLGDFEEVQAHLMIDHYDKKTKNFEQCPEIDRFEDDIFGLGVIYLMLHYPRQIREFETEIKKDYITWKDANDADLDRIFEDIRKRRPSLVNAWDAFFTPKITIHDFMRNDSYHLRKSVDVFHNVLVSLKSLPAWFMDILRPKTTNPNPAPSADDGLPEYPEPKNLLQPISYAPKVDDVEPIQRDTPIQVYIDMPSVPRQYRFTYPHKDEVSLFGKLRMICDRRVDALEPSDLCFLRSNMEVALQKLEETRQEASQDATLSLNTPVRITVSLHIPYVVPYRKHQYEIRR